MSKRQFRFGRVFMQRSMKSIMLVWDFGLGRHVPVYRDRRHIGGKGLQVWAFAIPKPALPEPQPELEPIEVKVRDVESTQPTPESETQDSETSPTPDTRAGREAAEGVGE